VSQDTYTCPRCRAPIAGEQAACPRCNLALDAQSITAWERQQVARYWRRQIWLILLMIVIAGICSVLFVLGGTF